MKTLLINVSQAARAYDALVDSYLIRFINSTASNAYDFDPEKLFFGEPLQDAIVDVMERYGVNEFEIL